MVGKDIIIKLFRLGKLNIVDAEHYVSQGFAFVCQDGRLVDIIFEGVEVYHLNQGSVRALTQSVTAVGGGFKAVTALVEPLAPQSEALPCATHKHQIV